MPQKGPHISTLPETLINRVLHINEDEFAEWPEAVRKLAMEIAQELFLVRYNPFVKPDMVKASVQKNFENQRLALDLHYANTINEGITMFWSAHDADMAFRRDIVNRLYEVLPRENLDLRPASRVENATDATDLRLELPLLVVTPATEEEVSAVVRLANEMQFALIPRGGGSGQTGGAVPARKRSVILSLNKLNRIRNIDLEKRNITLEAGVITSDAIAAAAEKKLLLSIDPASKTASSIGGNISENAGGPLAVEYGTTIDNLLSYRMVLPTGEIIEISRKNHPRHKIELEDRAAFEVRDLSGGLRNYIEFKGPELRKPGLGKDVTDKALKGLPGVQKEGTDGIITVATFVLHNKCKHERVMVIEFYGRSMHNATLAINDLMAMREEFRRQGGVIKLTMLEEFNSKYVQAIEYRKKSTLHEGDPISVLIVQIDSDDEYAIDEAVREMAAKVDSYKGTGVFVAKDAKEAELFWEDRHRLSAIAKRTSGFKINEDIVIPIAALPAFAIFLEELNIECMARAYRRAMQAVSLLRGVDPDDPEFNGEFSYASRILKGEEEKMISDQELQLHAVLFLRSLREQYPRLAGRITAIEEHMLASQIVVASHMHAGDGNCHVNIPVNSGDPDMLHEAELIAGRVMEKAKDLGGAITGEHGVGITKIAFQEEGKIVEMRKFKELVDPRNIMNPAKLTRRELPVSTFTFSFNRLIQDLQQSGLPGRNALISLLTKVQICTRCGKCKEVCAMHYPAAGMFFYPRNRNITLGAIIEAIYYSQVNDGKPDPALMRELHQMVEHCTGCGKCHAVCPVKIDSAEVALVLRALLTTGGVGGHAIKNLVLNWLVQNPARRVPMAAKMASLGQRVQNKFLPFVPPFIKNKFENPLFAGTGPVPGYRHLRDDIKLGGGSIFVPKGEVKGTLFFFPGCSGMLFFRSIGLGGLMLGLKAGWAVVLPPETMCCGYPLLSAGLYDAYCLNRDRNIEKLQELAEESARAGYPISRILTSCGSCRDGLERHHLSAVFNRTNRAADPDEPLPEIERMDIIQMLLDELPDIELAALPELTGEDMPDDGFRTAPVLYHAPCHVEYVGVNKKKAGDSYARAINRFAGLDLKVTTGCCGESGLGAMSSPAIYNKLRARKMKDMAEKLEGMEARAPILVGCPSCKMGITRSLLRMKEKRPVLHTAEYLAQRFFGKDWRVRCRKLAAVSAKGKGRKGMMVRLVDMESLPNLSLTQQEQDDDE
ncbi:MAG: FAD-binding oxidoreductase [Deltaproteobacteria bacterium]|jgi:FAD/FMN-containing dehydrogenase/Fe-S oxidoreductase|nr:FAD-binding oxidoreductase [Deltaproteobacteria bacterium]